MGEEVGDLTGEEMGSSHSWEGATSVRGSHCFCLGWILVGGLEVAWGTEGWYAGHVG